MSKHPEAVKKQLRGLDPVKPFYMAVSISNSDGSSSIAEACEPIEGAATEIEELADIAQELAEEHGSECFIYRCVPVRRIIRGKVRTIKFPEVTAE